METFIVDALACHRLARLIVDDVVFDGPRAHVMGALHAAGWEKGKELLRCTWCVGVWCGFGVVAARRYAPRGWAPVARALALADVAGHLSGLVG